jgi:methylglutamate dehydrogenase subunit D
VPETLVRSAGLAGCRYYSDHVQLEALDDAAWCVLIPRRNARAELAHRLEREMGLTPPQHISAVMAGSLTIVWAGSAWLVVQRESVTDLRARLARVSERLADVVDVSDSRVSVAVSGGRARDMLCRLVPIDLHPQAFAVGSAAATLCGHMDLLIWQTDPAPVFHLSCERSYADTLWHELEHAARTAW